MRSKNDEYYQPIIKKGHHLDKSRKNPDRVRGVSRDENNKNPDIVEWKKIKLPEQGENISYDKHKNGVDHFITILEVISTPEFQDTMSFILDNKDKIATGLKALGNYIKNKSSEIIYRHNNKKLLEQVCDSNERTPIITEHDINTLIGIGIEEAQKLKEMIYFILSIIKKDVTTQEENNRKQLYIEELCSDKARSIMKFFIQNPQLSDEDTVKIFSDCLNGYVRSGDELVPLQLKDDYDLIDCEDDDDDDYDDEDDE